MADIRREGTGGTDAPYGRVQGATQGQPAIEGDGKQTRDFIFVDDTVDALVRLAEMPSLAGEVINLGSGRETSVLMLVTDLCSALGWSGPIQHVAARAERTPSTVAVLFADLDEFKSVNDTFGHEAGDAVLVAVADRLLGVLRPGDTLARLGGEHVQLARHAYRRQHAR